MRYLCLIYQDEKVWEKMPREEAEAIFGEYFALTEGLKSSGNYIGGNPLQPTTTATTVRVRNGRVSATDGPFAETREQLGGYFLVEAADLDQVVAIAARIPAARWGTVEIRPVVEIAGLPTK